MAEILLLHHVLGLTAGVRAFAEALRRDHHTVHTPDLFEGRLQATIEEGAAVAQELAQTRAGARGVLL